MAGAGLPFDSREMPGAITDAITQRCLFCSDIDKLITAKLLWGEPRKSNNAISARCGWSVETEN
jgi:hypothetical protein